MMHERQVRLVLNIGSAILVAALVVSFVTVIRAALSAA
jgi:hypothetical protein